MAGENGLFGAAGYPGTLAIPGPSAMFKVMTMGYGLEMFYEEKETANQRVIYFSHMVDDNFTVNLGFNGWQAYDNAATWFANYGTFVTDPTNTTVAPMSVTIPFLNFSGVGIPHIGITHGDQMVELMYVLSVEFVGTSGALAPASDQTAAPTSGGANLANQYFYPQGLVQGSSTSTDEITLYDSASSAGAITATNQGSQVSKPITASSAPGNPVLNSYNPVTLMEEGL